MLTMTMNRVRLSDLVDVAAFRDLVERGFISARTDEVTGLTACSYTRETLYAGLWTPETMTARGLIVDFDDDGVDAVVVARGLSKFFTVDQANSEWGRLKMFDDDEGVEAEDIVVDETAPAIVSDKLDGSMGVLVVHNGTARFATKGSLNSNAALEGNRVLSSKYDADDIAHFMSEHYLDATPVFEIITPAAVHVVNYGDVDDVTFLGMVDNFTGRWTPAALDHALSDEFHFPTPRVYPASTLAEALSMPYDPNHEGVVITVNNDDGTQQLFKVKYDEFFKIRKVRYALTVDTLKGMVASTPTSDLLSAHAASSIDMRSFAYAFNVDYGDIKWLIDLRRNEVWNELILPFRERVRDVVNAYDSLDLDGVSTRKEFALAVKAAGFPREVSSIVFLLWEVPSDDIVTTAADAIRRKMKM